VPRSYHTLNKRGKMNERKLVEFLSKHGQQFLPMVELIEQSRLAVEDLIDSVGRVTLQTVLHMSAEQVAGPPQQGKSREHPIFWHGRQGGSVYLKERKLAVEKPRLRERTRGNGKEVPIPAYEAMQDRAGMGARMLEILLHGVSTRHYEKVIPQMAETMGVSKSNVSREAVAASEAALSELLSRRFEDVDILIIYIDGVFFGEQCVIAAVGVDDQGKKHVLGIREGATENSAAVKDLLEDLVERGVNPNRRRLFVIDGSKALRAGINAIFGADSPVQRCRNHKLRNVLERLPEAEQAQARSLMRAAWKLDARSGMARLEKLAQWLEREYPDAAGSLREGMAECFTINRLDVPLSLHRCLATTNLIESPQAGVRMKTRRVCRWRDQAMVKRWAGAAFVATEKNFRRIMGYRDLWALKAILDGSKSATRKVVA
jgi:putative transposase